jgi:hypothetical protein
MSARIRFRSTECGFPTLSFRVTQRTDGRFRTCVAFSRRELLARALNDGAAIILNTRVAGIKGTDGKSAYSAATAALRSLARESG